MIGAIAWLRWRRKSRWPFKDTDKLLRGPGETLRKRIVEIDEQMIVELGSGIAGSMLAFGLAGLLLPSISSFGAKQITALSLVVTFAVQGTSVWRIGRLWNERANKFLGWYGERFAANFLRPLEREGYYVFHDVPFAGASGPYNIDHVVVGPTGVTVIEVKTFRKRSALPDRSDYEVTFDGAHLHWPWGQDDRAIEQTKNAARSLSEWIRERTGIGTAVRAVLTFPTWYVHEKPNSDLRVVQTKFLPDTIKGRRAVVLSPEEIELVARQLGIQCRDVVD